MKILGLLVFLAVSRGYAENKIVVIDSGIKTKDTLTLCKDEHKDFTDTDLYTDTRNHGNLVSHLIEKEIDKSVDFCQIILKYTDKTQNDGDGAKNLISALEYTLTLDNVKIVNLSISGFGSIEKEKRLIKQLLDKKIQIVVAAGNKAKNLDDGCYYYPACYDKRLHVVGNGPSFDERHETSNYGQIIDVWIDGINSKAGGDKGTGTSMSAAIYTGKLANVMFKTQGDK